MDARTYSIPEVARLLGLGRSAAYAAAERGDLPVPVLRIGRRMVVPRAPLDRLLDGSGAEPRRAGEHGRARGWRHSTMPTPYRPACDRATRRSDLHPFDQIADEALAAIRRRLVLRALLERHAEDSTGMEDVDLDALLAEDGGA